MDCPKCKEQMKIANSYIFLFWSVVYFYCEKCNFLYEKKCSVLVLGDKDKG